MIILTAHFCVLTIRYVGRVTLNDYDPNTLGLIHAKNISGSSKTD